MLAKIIFLIIVLDCLTSCETLQKNFIITLDAVICDCRTPIAKRLECDMKQLGIGRYAISGKLQLGRVLHKNAEVQLLVYVKRGEKHVMKFIDAKANICFLLRSANTLPLGKQIMNEVMRTSNIPRLCPIKGNSLYTMTNATLTDEYFPTYTPIMQYNLSINFYEHRSFLGGITFYGRTLPKGSRSVKDKEI